MGFNKYFSEKHYSANCFFSEFTFLYLIYTLKLTPFSSFCTNCCLSFCLISVLNSHTLRVSLSFCLCFCHVCLNLTFMYALSVLFPHFCYMRKVWRGAMNLTLTRRGKKCKKTKKKFASCLSVLLIILSYLFGSVLTVFIVSLQKGLKSW